MELKFDQSLINYMEDLNIQAKQQEQTQEVKLPDGMPDIGRILGCWGQPVIRSKEWRSDSITVSGGLMAWVLYAPEDGSAPNAVDTWIPFQAKWEIPPTDQDGVITASVRLQGMDARITSARKLMIRAAIQIAADVHLHSQCRVSAPVQLPDHVQLLRESYPVELLMEAGERQVTLDEDVALPGNFPPVSKIVRFELNPEITEQKLMGSRLVFRGICRLHLLYMAEEGTLHSWDYETPVSQFSDLDGEYGSSASCAFTPVVTGVELEPMEDGKLQLKASLAVQYGIFDRAMVEIVEDAYCPKRDVKVETETLKIPVRLDRREDQLNFSQTIHANAQQIVDCCACTSLNSVRQVGDDLEAELQIVHQVLYLDENGSLQGATGRSEEIWKLPSDSDNRVRMHAVPASRNVAVGENIDISGTVEMQTSVFSDTALNMVTGLTVGEQTAEKQDRPSLILKKTGEKRLWDIAKECGSTVDAICKANQLQQEPLPERMLLIPVL